MNNMTLIPTINTRNHNCLSLFDSLEDLLGPNGFPTHLDFPPEGEKVQSFNWKENADSYSLKLEIPGFKLSEIDVDFHEGKLTITAESKRAGYENKFYKEIYVSNFERVDASKANAKLEDGILSINLPKSEKTKGRKIVVQ